jgi:hypothetical protein
MFSAISDPSRAVVWSMLVEIGNESLLRQPLLDRRPLRRPIIMDRLEELLVQLRNTIDSFDYERDDKESSVGPEGGSIVFGVRSATVELVAGMAA